MLSTRYMKDVFLGSILWFGGGGVRRLEGRDGDMIDSFCSYCWWVIVGVG